MRARAQTLVAVSLLSVGSVLATFACSNANGTFPSQLPYYDPDAGYVPPYSADSGADGSAGSATDGGDATAPSDAGDSGPKADSGDASGGDAATDSGDSGEPSDAADSGG